MTSEIYDCINTSMSYLKLLSKKLTTNMPNIITDLKIVLYLLAFYLQCTAGFRYYIQCYLENAAQAIEDTNYQN